MSHVTIEAFAKQISISVDKLLDQLEQAGISGKAKDDLLDDGEKIKLLQFLKGVGPAEGASRERISVKRRSTDQVRQTSRTGIARTVHVEVKKTQDIRKTQRNRS